MEPTYNDSIVDSFIFKHVQYKKNLFFLLLYKTILDSKASGYASMDFDVCVCLTNSNNEGFLSPLRIQVSDGYQDHTMMP